MRYGGGHGLASSRAIGGRGRVPVCSPRFNDGRLPKTSPSSRMPAAAYAAATRDEWFRRLRRKRDAVAPSGMTFSETDLLLRAAIDGLGIALSRRMLAQPELDAGRPGAPGATASLPIASISSCIRMVPTATGATSSNWASSTGSRHDRVQRHFSQWGCCWAGKLAGGFGGASPCCRHSIRSGRPSTSLEPGGREWIPIPLMA